MTQRSNPCLPHCKADSLPSEPPGKLFAWNLLRRQFSSAAELEEGGREPNGAGVPWGGGHPREAEPEVEGGTEPDDIPELPDLNVVNPLLGFYMQSPSLVSVLATSTANGAPGTPTLLVSRPRAAARMGSWILADDFSLSQFQSHFSNIKDRWDMILNLR